MGKELSRAVEKRKNNIFLLLLLSFNFILSVECGLLKSGGAEKRPSRSLPHKNVPCWRFKSVLSPNWDFFQSKKSHFLFLPWGTVFEYCLLELRNSVLIYNLQKRGTVFRSSLPALKWSMLAATEVFIQPWKWRIYPQFGGHLEVFVVHFCPSEEVISNEIIWNNKTTDFVNCWTSQWTNETKSVKRIWFSFSVFFYSSQSAKQS